jgi:hypothetical protein
MRIVIYLFIYLFIYLLLCWGYIVTFTKDLTKYQICHTWIHPSIILILPSPIPGIVSAGLIFPFINMCTQNLYHIHTPIPLPHIFPPPTDTNTPRKDLFCLLVLWICKRKKVTFLFVKDSYTGSSMYKCIIIWISSSPLFLRKF